MLSARELERVSAATAAKPGQRVYVRSSMPGTSYGDVELEGGRVATLTGAPNDGRLIRMGTLVPLGNGVPTSRCAECKAEFVTSFLPMHMRRAHEAPPRRVLDAEPAPTRILRCISCAGRVEFKTKAELDAHHLTHGLDGEGEPARRGEA